MNKRRPTQQYLDERDVDEIARHNTQLIAELWIVKDRLTVLESLLVKKGLLNENEIDSVTPDGALAAALEHDRDSYIKKVLGLPGELRTADNLKSMGAPQASSEKNKA